MLFFKQCPVSYNTPYEKIGDEVRSLADEVPFDIPDSWEWVTLQAIATSSLGKTLDKAKNKGDLKPYLCSINVYWDGIDLTTVKEARLEENELPKYRLRPGDLLICEGGDVGRSAVWESTQEMYYQNALHRVRFYGGINPHFFQLLLECYKGNQTLDAYSKGMTIKHLVQTALNTIIFPLPPLSEQTRIVDAVNRLLPYLYSYNRAEQKLTALNADFPEALKKSILQEAVQGKLVAQDPSDEPAEALLERIRVEKQRLIKEKKIKKDKHESIIFRRDNSHYEKLDGVERCIDEELPFEIPENWCWVRFGTAITLLSGTDFAPDEYNSAGKGIAYITGASNIVDSQIRVNRWTESPRQITHAGDILLVCKGSGYGKTVICNIEQAHIARQIMAVQKCNLLDMQYIKLFLDSSFDLLKTKGQGVIPGIDRTSVLHLLFPLPPLNEQHRIIQRIEKLLPLVKGL